MKKLLSILECLANATVPLFFLIRNTIKRAKENQKPFHLAPLSPTKSVSFDNERQRRKQSEPPKRTDPINMRSLSDERSTASAA